LLETRLGSDVVYTRQDDNYIPLDERAGIANQAQADLFVSVHANYSDLPSARGVETYYTNFFSAPNAKDVETRANAGGSKPAVTAALSPADLHERIEQSRRLAGSVQRCAEPCGTHSRTVPAKWRAERPPDASSVRVYVQNRRLRKAGGHGMRLIVTINRTLLWRAIP